MARMATSIIKPSGIARTGGQNSVVGSHCKSSVSSDQTIAPMAETTTSVLDL